MEQRDVDEKKFLGGVEKNRGDFFDDEEDGRKNKKRATKKKRWRCVFVRRSSSSGFVLRVNKRILRAWKHGKENKKLNSLQCCKTCVESFCCRWGENSFMSL